MVFTQFIVHSPFEALNAAFNGNAEIVLESEIESV